MFVFGSQVCISYIILDGPSGELSLGHVFYGRNMYHNSENL